MHVTEAIHVLWAMLRRRRVLAIAIFLGMGGLAAMAILGSTTRYTARTTLLAKFGREYVFRDGATPLVPNIAQDDIVSAVVDILKSILTIRSSFPTGASSCQTTSLGRS